MTFPTKNRRPSRLFSWISQLARRASDTSSILPQVSSVVYEYPTPSTTPNATTTVPTHQRSPSGTSTAIPLSTSPPSFFAVTAAAADDDDDDDDDEDNEEIMAKSADTEEEDEGNTSETENDDAQSMVERRLRQQQLQQLPRQPSLQQRKLQQQQAGRHHRRRPASVFSLPNSKTATEPTYVPRHSCEFEHKRPTSITNSFREPRHRQSSSNSNSWYCPRSDWPRPDRMIIRQELIRLALDGLYYSPADLNGNSRILHVGCGDGSWCIEMAKRYKDSTVMGMDLHDAIDRTNKNLPSNFKFVHAKRSLLHTLRRQPDSSFDFIFVRFLIFSCPPDLYRELIQECWRVCKPRGFVEMMELDMQIYGNPRVGPITKMLNAQVIYKMQHRALDPHFAQHLQDFFFFHELVEQMHQRHGDAYHAKYTSLPLGMWGGRIGVMFRDDWHDLIEAVHAANPEKGIGGSTVVNISSSSKSRIIHPADLAGGPEGDDDDDDDDGYHDREDDDLLANYDPWTDQRLKATLERVDEELETHWSFMNLHHAYAQKQ